MSETSVFPWVPLAAVVTGVIALTIVTGGVRAALRVAFDEVNYRAGMGEIRAWAKRLG